MDKRWTWRVGWLLALLLALGAVAPLAAAQDGTPAASPAALGETIKSPTRDEVEKQILEKYPVEEAKSQGGQIIFGESGGDFTTVNALLSADFPSAYFVGLTFESLVGGSPITGQPTPGLADSWEIAPDGITYTFHINTDAKWHDGTDVTSDDVKFSYDSALNKDLNYQYASTIQEELDSYRVVDADTFEIKAKDRLVTFLLDVPGTVYIVPKHIW